MAKIKTVENLYALRFRKISQNDTNNVGEIVSRKCVKFLCEQGMSGAD